MSNTMNLEAIQSWVLRTCLELGLQIEETDDDFFAAGGTSLTAVKLIDRVEREFGEDSLPVDDLFSQSTVHDIASSIQRNGKRVNAVDPT